MSTHTTTIDLDMNINDVESYKHNLRSSVARLEAFKKLQSDHEDATRLTAQVDEVITNTQKVMALTITGYANTTSLKLYASKVEIFSLLIECVGEDELDADCFKLDVMSIDVHAASLVELVSENELKIRIPIYR